MENDHTNDFEFLSSKEIKNIQIKYGKLSRYILLFVVPAFFAFCYFGFQYFSGNEIPFYSKPLIAMFIVAVIAGFPTENTLSNHQYCDVDDAKEIIKLAKKHEKVTHFLVNINALGRKPTHSEYKEILSIGKRCEDLLITENSEGQKVFDELAGLGDLASLGKLANLEEKNDD